MIIASIIAIIIVGLSITVLVQSSNLKKTKRELISAINNVKAYENENSKLKKSNLQFEYTIDQLNNSQDSLVQKLNKARKDLKIKDKNLKELEYIASQNLKKDSIIVKDTIFRYKNFELDTLLKDNWSSLKLHLSYPNKVGAEYSFNNETIVATTTKKETVQPPKKFWICRLFQKKQTIVEVEVIQQNPYCKNGVEKHIKIIK